MKGILGKCVPSVTTVPEQNLYAEYAESRKMNFKNRKIPEGRRKGFFRGASPDPPKIEKVLWNLKDFQGKAATK